jgi:anti-sigma B factor antagonist
VIAQGADRWPDDPVPLSVDLAEDRGEPVVVVAGELDLQGCDRLVEAAARSAARGLSLTIDIRAVTFLDSTGARALLLADRAARDRGASTVRVLAAQGGATARILRLTGMHDLIDLRVDPAG